MIRVAYPQVVQKKKKKAYLEHKCTNSKVNGVNVINR